MIGVLRVVWREEDGTVREIRWETWLEGGPYTTWLLSINRKGPLATPQGSAGEDSTPPMESIKPQRMIYFFRWETGSKRLRFVEFFINTNLKLD